MSECLGKWVSAYVDGELDGRRRDRVVAHLAGCTKCRELVESERTAKQRLAATTLPAASPELRARLMDAEITGPIPVVEAPNHRMRNRLVVAGVATAGTAAAVAVVVAAPRAGAPGPVVTPPIQAFTVVHYGDTVGIPVGGPGLGVQPAAFQTTLP